MNKEKYRLYHKNVWQMKHHIILYLQKSLKTQSLKASTSSPSGIESNGTRLDSTLKNSN